MRIFLAAGALILAVSTASAQGGRGGGVTTNTQVGDDDEWDESGCPKCSEMTAGPITGNYWHWFPKTDTASAGDGAKCRGSYTGDTLCHKSSKNGYIIVRNCDGGILSATRASPDLLAKLGKTRQLVLASRGRPARPETVALRRG